MQMTSSEWDKEVEYCTRLVETSGNTSIPAESVLTYLQMQENSARREGCDGAANAISDLIRDWMGG